MNDEVRFIDLFSGIGGFRLGLERANEERRILRRQDMHGHRTDADECLEHGRKAPSGHISQESHRGSFGLERANYSAYEQIANGDASSRGAGFEEQSESQLSACLAELEKANQVWPISTSHNLQTSGISTNDLIGIRSETYEKSSGLSCSENTRFRCVWSCDNNKYANQVYAKQFGEANHHSGDIRGVDPGEIPDFDLLCAGFPCQSFSVAGKRKGFQDTRGTLFFEISRIAEAKRPQMLLLENVKGLLSSDRGQTFQTILQELGRIGYWTEWQVLNSKHHGVPQNRERVFIIGHLRNGSTRPIFPIGKADEMAEEDGRGRPPVQPQVSTAIDGSYYKRVDRHGQRTVVLDTFNRGGVKEGEAYSLKTNPSPTSSAVIGVELAYTKANMRQGRFSEVSHALDSGGSKGVAISFTNPHDPEEERKVNLSDISRAVKPPYGNQQPLVLRPKDDWFSQHAIYSSEGVGPTLRGDQNDPAPRILHNIYGGFKEGIRVFDKNSPTIRTSKGGGHIPSVVVLADRTRTLAGKGRNLESPKPITNALSGVQKDNLLLENFRIRRLTPVECERLQGFPDGWTEGLSDTQRYKCLGNAVTVNVITFLAQALQ